MQKDITKNFTSQIDQIIEQHKNLLDTEQKKLTSQSAAAGIVQSGGFVKQSLDLANASVISAVDGSLKFSLNYATNENTKLDDLIDVVVEKFQTYKNLTWKNLDENHLIKPFLERGGVKKIFEDEKLKLDAAITVKIESARDGWLNQEKIYNGGCMSPSLNFFNKICLKHEQIIRSKIPSLEKRFKAVYDNLESDNFPDWANAVHECRKIFHDLSDTLFPPQVAPRKKGQKEIKLDEKCYTNRLICFVEDNSKSETYSLVISAELEDFIKKLEALYGAANKGSHAKLTEESRLTKEHAYTFVAYTYLLVGDILSLIEGEV